MESTAHLLARELVATDHLVRQAKARRTMLVAEFASNYSVSHDDVLPVLAEGRVALGLGAPSVSEFTCLEVAWLLGTTPAAAAGMIADAVNLRHRHPGLCAQMVDLAIEPDRACAAARKCQPEFMRCLPWQIRGTEDLPRVLPGFRPPARRGV